MMTYRSCVIFAVWIWMATSQCIAQTPNALEPPPSKNNAQVYGGLRGKLTLNGKDLTESSKCILFLDGISYERWHPRFTEQGRVLPIIEFSKEGFVQRSVITWDTQGVVFVNNASTPIPVRFRDRWHTIGGKQALRLSPIPSHKVIEEVRFPYGNDERSWISIFVGGNPYVINPEADGKFLISDVPTGPHKLYIIKPGVGNLRRASGNKEHLNYVEIELHEGQNDLGVVDLVPIAK
jgi:hypothetical protein